MSVYDSVYIVSNLLGAYAIYLFFTIFYEEKDKKTDLLVFGVYYVLNLILSMIVAIPMYNLLFNVIAFILIGLYFEKSIKKAILSALYVYVILVIAEIPVVILSGFIRLPVTEKHDYSIIWGIIAINVINYVTVLIIRNYFHARKGETVPISYWISLVFMPVSTLYMLIAFYNNTDLDNNGLILVSVLILVMNFAVFYLYDLLNKYYEMKNREDSMKSLNRSYEQQLQIMNESNHKIRGMRHDLRHHVNVMNEMISRNKMDDLQDYLAQVDQTIQTTYQIASTGNNIIDTVINYEMSIAKAQEINIDFKSGPIPEDISISDYDLTSLISNVLSNSVQASSKAHEKYINIMIEYKKGALYFYVENSYDGIVEKDGERFITRKKDKSNHGLGLNIVKGLVEKHNGTLAINNDEKVFNIEILIFI